MKVLKSILYSLLVLVILALIAGLVIISSVKRGALPKYNGEIKLSGLTDDVTVYRDERGMPHIYAKDEYDLYYAVGYVIAQERLWQMDMIRRATLGRLSEILGKDYVDIDLFLRCLDIPAKSKKLLAVEDPAIILCLQAYSDGVNNYIKDAGKKLPPEFRILSYKPDLWTIEDCTNIIGYIGWDLASDNFSSDLFNYKLYKKFGVEKANQLIPDWKADTSVVYPDFRLDKNAMKDVEKIISSMDKLEALGLSTFSGSNNWAVTGRRTETGKPVLSNDMHMALDAPGIWIQVHQVVPGKLNVTGVIVPGQPFIIDGHNEKVAWGMTNFGLDDIDLFAERINPVDSNQYFFKGEWKNMKVRDEVINIKGGEQKILKLRFTHRGPIISGMKNINDAALSMRWAGYDPSDEIRTVYLLNRASNWQEFRSAISTFRAISQNFVYADVEGNIGLNSGGGIALRKGNGTIIRSGETDEYDWKGYVPFEQLPSSYNPEIGYVSSANNKTAGDDYPYFIGYEYALPYRINRIRQMLNEKEIFGMEDFKRMIMDQHSDYSRLLTPYILKIKEKNNDLNPEETFALNSLSGWDYELNMNLVAPTVFEFFTISFAKNLLSDELADLFGKLTMTIKDYYIYKILTSGPDEWVDDINTSGKETLDDIILRSFKDCIKDMTAQYGRDTTKWKWGDIHTVTFVHPLSAVKILDKVFGLNSKTYGIGGSGYTVSPFKYDSGFKAYHGASQRHIFNTANWDESLTVIPTGISGVPASEFYMSQTDAYINGKFYKDAFTEGAVKAAARYTLVLKAGR
jgi:penicillin amidase